MNDLTGGNLGRARRGVKALSRTASALIALQVATDSAFAQGAVSAKAVPLSAVSNVASVEELADGGLRVTLANGRVVAIAADQVTRTAEGILISEAALAEIESAASLAATAGGFPLTAVAGAVGLAGAGGLALAAGGGDDDDGPAPPANRAPTFTSTAVATTPENATATGLTVTAGDADGDAVTYSISGGADAGRFAINASTGALSFVAAPDFEMPADAGANNVYDLIVTASDGRSGSSTQAIAVTVTNVAENRTPSITSVATANAAENQSTALTVTATDPDGDTLGYAITGGADAARFAINAATGALSFVAAPDFEAPSDAETNNVYDVAVTVTDGRGGSATQAIAVTVTNVAENRAPTFTSAATATAAENQSAASTVTATDPDGDTLNYAITGGADATRFAINTATGALSFVAAPDFEVPSDAGANNVYDVAVTVTDGRGGSATQAIAITVTDVAENRAPAITSAATTTAAENQSTALTVTATDPDGDTLSYAITGGVDAARFAIDAATGALSFVTSPDFEAPGDVGANNIYDAVVTASDGRGGSATQAIAVTVTDINETPPPPPPPPPSAVAPSAIEQLMVELVNRARANPAAELDKLVPGMIAAAATDPTVADALSFFRTNIQAIAAQLSGRPGLAPLAWDGRLGASADAHNAVMLAADEQAHQLPGEADLAGRIVAQGYQPTVALENIFAFGMSPTHAHASLFLDWGPGTDGIQTGALHREAILSTRVTSIGIGVATDTSADTDLGELVMTQHLATSPGEGARLVGVVFADADANDFYGMGEGVGGLVVTATGANGTISTATWDSGGYQLALAAGTYSIAFSGAALARDMVRSVTIGQANVKLDLDLPAQPDLVTLALATDSGIAGDRVTNAAGIVLTVNAAAGLSSLQVRIDDGAPVTLTPPPSGGQVALTPAAFGLASFAEGTHRIQVDSRTPTGLVESDSLDFTLDTLAPALTAFGLAASSDLGAAGDNVTTARLVSVTGTAEAGRTVTIGSESVIVPASGRFILSGVALQAGANTITAQVADLAGNVATQAVAVTYDTSSALETPVLEWVAVTLQAVRLASPPPTVVSRLLAIQSVAVLDAIAAIDGTPGYISTQTGFAGGSVSAAVAQASRDAIVAMVPDLTGFADAMLAQALARLGSDPAVALGRAAGSASAAAVVADRADDGYADYAVDTGAEGVGLWEPTGPFFEPGEAPNWATMNPWAIPAADALRPGGPPALTSADYAAALNEVQSLGRIDSTTRTADQTEIARFWLGAGSTVTPGGMWTRIGLEQARTRGGSATEDALLFSILGVALADSSIAAWNTKYAIDLWRPIDAIREADLDDNAATIVDANWQPFQNTPNHPEYVSGHATYSGAGAAVLSAIFGDRAFSTTSEDLPGVTRSYGSFSDAASEAARSRVFAGIHYSFSGNDGLALGTAAAEFALRAFDRGTDTAPPVVRIAGTRDRVSADAIDITGQVTDFASGVSGLTVSINGGAAQSLAIDASGRFTFRVADAADGVSTLRFVAVDVAGNVSAVETVTVTIDQTAPTIALTGLANGSTVAQGQLLDGTANGTGSAITTLTYTVDGGTTKPLSFDPTTGAFSTPLLLGELLAGGHRLGITAVDVAGNVATSTIDVTVANTPPFYLVGIEPDENRGEAGLTIHPMVQFSRAVDPATLTADSFFASAPDGTKLPATIVVAQDGMRAWLFFDDALPGASRITLNVEGSLIRAANDGTYLDANANASPGGSLDYAFTTVGDTGVPGTIIQGRVVGPGVDLQPMTRDDFRAGADGASMTADDVFLNPLAGVKVFILGREDRFVLTDAQGRFTLTDTPTGAVKVAIDGRTATNAPAGFFFPEMVMDVEIEPGRVNTLMGAQGTTEQRLAMQTRTEVYLPQLPTSMLKAVAAGTVVDVGLELAGVSEELLPEEIAAVKLTVSGDAMIGANGQRMAGGRVGISTVPPELVRDMLPAGLLQHTFDITIQAPGVTLFDTPLRLTLPNVFDAAPGTQLNFLSFDHNTGRLVIEGTATVSADGLTVTTDPGFGITKPGWHGVTPPGTDTSFIPVIPDLTPPIPPFPPVPPLDTDDDGIPDFDDPDIDGDDILNNADGDDDGDGTPDTNEGDVDTDDDGIVDQLDADDDSDGIPDADDTDDDGDDIPDDKEGVKDSDNDGIPDHKDADADGDGKLNDAIDEDDDDGDGIKDAIDEDDPGNNGGGGDDEKKKEDELFQQGFSDAEKILQRLSQTERDIEGPLNKIIKAKTIVGEFEKATSDIYELANFDFQKTNTANDVKRFIDAYEKAKGLFGFLSGDGAPIVTIEIDVAELAKAQASVKQSEADLLKVKGALGLALDGVIDASRQDILRLQQRVDIASAKIADTKSYLDGVQLASTAKDVSDLKDTLTSFPADPRFKILGQLADTGVTTLKKGIEIVETRTNIPVIETALRRASEGDEAGANEIILKNASKLGAPETGTPPSANAIEVELGDILQLGDVLSDEEIAELKAILMAGVAALTELAREILPPESTLSARIDLTTAFVADLGVISTALSEIVPVFFGFPRNAPYRITGDGVDLRGFTDGTGALDVFLPAERQFTLEILDPVNDFIGRSTFTTARSGSPTTIPLPAFRGSALLLDSDGDLLADEAEAIVGTSATRGDTDRDGISDRAELLAGTDPLGDFGATQGPQATVDIGGAIDDITVVQFAQGPYGRVGFASTPDGIVILDLSRRQPTVISRIDTTAAPTGFAVDVDTQTMVVTSTDRVATFDLADLTGPTAIRVTGEGAQHVAFVDGFIVLIAGTTILTVDPGTGQTVAAATLPAAVIDLAVDGDLVYLAGTNDRLSVWEVDEGTLVARGSVTSGTSDNFGKIVVGEGTAYGTLFAFGTGGVITFDVSNPDAPTQTAATPNAGFPPNALALSGTGLALLAGDNGPSNVVDLVDLSDPRVTNAFLARFPFTAQPTAVAMAGGIGYVGGTDGVFTVLNYRAPDVGSIAPTVTITGTPVDIDPVRAGIQVIEGTELDLAALIDDDVEVSDVTLLIDGVPQVRDLSFPYELAATAPMLTDLPLGGDAIVDLTVRAVDTGGNVAISTAVSVEIVADTFAPEVRSLFPLDNAFLVADDAQVSVRFSEVIDLATVDLDQLAIVGTADPVRVYRATTIDIGAQGKTLVFRFDDLPVGAYEIRYDPTGTTDLAGNAIVAQPIVNAVRAFTPTVRWTGAIDSDWFKGGNWSDGQVPDATDTVLIEALGRTVAIATGAAVAEAIYVASGALALRSGSLTADTVSFTATSAFAMTSGTLTGAALDGPPSASVSLAGTLSGVTLNVDAVHPDNARLVIRDGLTINGDFTMSAISSFTDLVIGSNQTIGGTGILRFSSENNASILNRIFIGENDGASGLVTFGPDLELVGGEVAIFDTGGANDRIALLGRLESTGGREIYIASGIDNGGAALGIAATAGKIVLDGAVANIRLVGTTADTIELRSSAIGNFTSDVGLLVTGVGSLTAATVNANTTIADNASQTIRGGLTLNAELLVNGVSSFTDVYAAGSQTIGGTGSIRFSNEGNASTLNRVYVGDTDPLTGTLTIGAGIELIGGEGGFYRTGASTDTLTLLGGVQTRAAGDLLYFDVGIANGGAALAVDTARGALVFDNNVTAATLNGTAGSQVEFRSSIVTGVTANLGGTITGTGTLDAVTLNGNFTIADNASQTIRGGLTINNDLTMNGVNSFTDLTIGSNQTIGGTGSLRFSSENNASILNRIFIGENDGVSGLVTFGTDLELVGGEVDIGDAGGANDRVELLGRLESTGGRTLYISSDLDNGNAALGIAATAGAIVLDGAVANIRLAGTAADTVELRSSAASNLVSDVGLRITGSGSLTGSTLNADSVIADNAGQTIAGGLTINAELLVDGVSSFTDLAIGSGQTIGGTGSIRFSNEGNAATLNRVFVGENDLATGTLTVGAGIELVGGEGGFYRTGGSTDTLTLLGGVQTRAAGDLLYFDVGIANGGAALAVDTAQGALVFDNAVTAVTLNGTVGSRAEFRSSTVTGVTANLAGTITGGGALDAVTLNGDFVIADNAMQTIRGGLTLNAELFVNGVSSFTDVYAAGGQTIGGTGSIRFSNEGNAATLNRVFVGDADPLTGTLTIGAGIELVGGEGGFYRTGASTDTLTLLGGVQTRAASDLLYFDVGIANGGAALAVDTAQGALVFDNNVTAATLNGTAGSQVEFRSSIVTGVTANLGGTITGTGALDAVTLNGDFVVADSAGQTIRGGLTINADLLVNGVSSFTDLTIGSNQTIGGTGTLRFSSENNASTLNRVFIGENDGVSGTVTLDGVGLVLGEADFIAQGANDRLVIDSTVTVGETGRLFLNVDTELSDDALLAIAIRSGATYGRIGGEQDLVLNGDLLLNFANDVDYVAGDRFAIIEGPELSGDFDDAAPDEVDSHPVVFEPAFGLDRYSAVLQ